MTDTITHLCLSTYYDARLKNISLKKVFWNLLLRKTMRLSVIYKSTTVSLQQVFFFCRIWFSMLNWTGERNSCTWGMLGWNQVETPSVYWVWQIFYSTPNIGCWHSQLKRKKERKEKPDPSNCRISTLKQHNSSYDIAPWKPLHSASLPFASDHLTIG